MRRPLLVVIGAASVAVAYACSTFDSANDATNDAGDEAAADDAGAPDAAVDAPVDDGGLAPDAEIVEISAGHVSACAVTSAGRVRCWGSNASGAAGEPPAEDVQYDVGSQYADGGGAISSEGCRPTPTTVQGLLAGKKAVHVATGSYYACARTADELYCWGSNKDARLGVPLSQTGASPAPQLVAIPNVLEVFTGETFAFARARENDGGVTTWSWGANEAGQLALGTIADASADGAPLPATDTNHPPTRTLLPVDQRDIVVAALVGRFACSRSGMQVRCWGANVAGVLGHGAGTNGDVACPTAPSTSCNPTPKTVPGNFDTLDQATFPSACASSGGQYLCWGSNLWGLLAQGAEDYGNHATPETATKVPPNTIQVSGRYSHACAVTSGGEVYCWGSNSYGELGRWGTTDAGVLCTSNLRCRFEPERVEGLPPIAAVESGAFFTVALARDGTVWAWGANARGALGHAPGTNGDFQCPDAIPSYGLPTCNPKPSRIVFP